MLSMVKARSPSNRIFSKNQNSVRRIFERQRATMARKLQNPRLLQIHFHTFRHWKATNEYARTKDILHVMRLLGHKRIQNTLIYTQLVNFGEKDWNVQVAHNIDDACELVKVGFEYVTGEYGDGGKIFRKRK